MTTRKDAHNQIYYRTIIDTMLGYPRYTDVSEKERLYIEDLETELNVNNEEPVRIEWERHALQGITGARDDEYEQNRVRLDRRWWH